MRTGIGYPSYADQGVYTAATPANWDANYLPTSLGDLTRPSQVSRGLGTALAAVRIVFPAAVPVQMVSLINHNLPIGATWQVQGYSNTVPDGTATEKVYESGVINVWPSGGPTQDYPSIRPLVLSAPISMRSLQVVLFPTTPQQVLEVGAIDVASWLELPGISPGYEFTVLNTASRAELVGGGTVDSDSWAPRALNGQVDLISMTVTGTTWLDFQRDHGKQRPFVFVKDLDDPATWARTCMLAVNAELPPSVGAMYRHDKMQFRFREHWK